MQHQVLRLSTMKFTRAAGKGCGSQVRGVAIRGGVWLVLEQQGRVVTIREK